MGHTEVFFEEVVHLAGVHTLTKSMYVSCRTGVTGKFRSLNIKVIFIVVPQASGSVNNLAVKLRRNPINFPLTLLFPQ